MSTYYSYTDQELVSLLKAQNESLNKLRKKAEAKVCEAVERVLVEILRVLRDVYVG